MEVEPEYRRTETRVDTVGDPRSPVVERQVVSTSRTTRFSPAAIIAGVGGVVLLVLGLVTVAKGGLSDPVTEPVVEVFGLTHTPLLGLIETGVGLLLLLCALWGARASVIFVGTLIAIAGVVVVATPDSFTDALAAETSYGWFLIVLGGVVTLVALAVPDWSSRVVTYR
jgi:hypothetical protein